MVQLPENQRTVERCVEWEFNVVNSARFYVFSKCSVWIQCFETDTGLIR